MVYFLIIGPVAGVFAILLHWVGFPPLFIASFLAFVGLCYAFKNELSLELVFNLLSRLIVDIFFREIETNNSHKIPPHGPLIIVSNHNNQFLDPAVLTHCCKTRNIHWLIAAKSYRDKTIGKFARASRAIPVERPQDLAKVGSGKIFHSDPNDPYLITGTDEVNFVRDFTGEMTEINKTNSISFSGEIFGIAEVVSINTLRIKPPTESHPPAFISQSNPISYKVTPKVDQHAMFSNVWDSLVNGECIGIFPEGGSTDRTSLLPLKAGVAIMALGAAVRLLDKFELECGIITNNDDKNNNNNNTKSSQYDKFQSVNILAVGLNYFHGHRFRGRVYADFGDPFQVPLELVFKFRQGGQNKIDACNALLDIIRDQLKIVTVQVESYTKLQVLSSVRRLYQPSGMKLPPKLVVVLVRRFAQAYELVKHRDDVKELVAEVESYNETLKYFGLRDHQVNVTQQSRVTAFYKLTFRLLTLFFLGIFAIPGSILNFPILLITRINSRKKAHEALNASTVKVAGRDVLASWKVLTALTVVPLLLCIYPILFATLASIYLGWLWLTVWGNFVILQPFMMWGAVLLVERGASIFNSLKPLYLAAFPPNDGKNGHSFDTNTNNDQKNSTNTNQNHPHIVQLRQTRSRLRFKIRQLVDVLGPTLYGPAFNQLRIFPFSSKQTNTMQVKPLQQAEIDAASRQEQIPTLIPQVDDLSDESDNAANTIKNLKPLQTTFNNNNTNTPPFNSFASPLPNSPSGDSDEANPEFVLNTDGEYVYNHQHKPREVHLPPEALHLLYQSSLTPTTQTNNTLPSQKQSTQRNDHSDTDGEETVNEMVVIDGVPISLKQQQLLQSESLQNISDLD